MGVEIIVPSDNVTFQMVANSTMLQSKVAGFMSPGRQVCQKKLDTSLVPVLHEIQFVMYS